MNSFANEPQVYTPTRKSPAAGARILRRWKTERIAPSAEGNAVLSSSVSALLSVGNVYARTVLLLDLGLYT